MNSKDDSLEKLNIKKKKKKKSGRHFLDATTGTVSFFQPRV